MTIGDGYVIPWLEKEKEKVSERVKVTPERGIPSRQITDLPRHEKTKGCQALNFPRGHMVRGRRLDDQQTDATRMMHPPRKRKKTDILKSEAADLLMFTKKSFEEDMTNYLKKKLNGYELIGKADMRPCENFAACSLEH